MLDVFVDIRKGSPSFGKWGSVELDANQPKLVLIPVGFAHGYLTLTDNCIVSYKVDCAYTPQVEGGLAWDDPAVGIKWPIATPHLSTKDRTLSNLDAIEPLDTGKM